MEIKRLGFVTLAFAAALAVSACGSTKTERGLSGAGIGAGVGAAGAAISGGSPVAGGLIGGAAGGATGYFTDEDDINLEDVFDFND